VGWFKRTSEARQALRGSAPLARMDGLAIEQLGDEVLIYDQRTNQAHCLSAAAGQVWRACDGKTQPQQLSAQLGLDAVTVKQAISELQNCGLLDGVREPGMTRREATNRLARVGAAAAAAPLIYSIVSPVPAAAQSLAACEAVNAVPGHDCGNQTSPHLGCGSVAGCCCCHNMSAPPSSCAGDNEHCCLTAAFCLASPPNGAGGNTCSNNATMSLSQKSSGTLQPNTGVSGGGGAPGGTGASSNAGGVSSGTGASGTGGLSNTTGTPGTP
jgi:hypothetical protein